jgi:hypothetical protein
MVKVNEYMHGYGFGQYARWMDISNLVFIIQNKFQNCLTTYLKLIVKIYSQTFYSSETFLFYKTICEWNAYQIWYGVGY